MYENHKCYSFSGWKGGTGLGFLRRWWDWMAAVEWPGKKHSFIFSVSNKILCAIPARLRLGLSPSPWRMNQNKNKTQNTPQCFSSGWFSKQAHEKVRRRGEIKEEKEERSRGCLLGFMTGCHVAQACLELSIEPRMVLSPRSSCLCLPVSGSHACSRTRPKPKRFMMPGKPSASWATPQPGVC